MAGGFVNFSALPEMLLAWAKTQGAALLQGGKAEQASPFKVGAEYEGKVLDQLPGGRHLVQVAGQKLDMGLPAQARAGDNVRLTFLSAGPRPTFLMNAQPQATPVQPVQISSSAQQVSALMRIAQPLGQVAQAAATGPAPRQAPLSPGASTGQTAAPPGARMSAPSVIQAGSVPAAAAGQASTVLANSTAVTDQSRITPTGQAAQALTGAANAAATQGAASARPIVANVVMLQGFTPSSVNAPIAVASPNTALLGQAVDRSWVSVGANTTLRPTVLADPAVASDNLLPSRLAQTVRESGLFYEAHLARWAKGSYPFEAILNEPLARLGRGAVPMPGMAELAGMPEDAARMAGRQLHMLEGGPFLWQGFAWPGQWMDWLVEERKEGQGDGQGGEEPNPWSTELRLTLPRMGAVQAHLSLRGQDVSLRLQAAEAGAAQAMTDALPMLQFGLESAGLRPVNLAVVTEEG